MKMKNKLIYSIFGLAFFGYVTLALWAVARQEIEPLLVCADSGGLNVPFSKNICRAYLFNFRGTKQDISELQQGSGPSFAVQGESSLQEREQILKFLVNKGMNINGIGMHQLTALHEAVLANSDEEIEMLLRNGADAALRDKKFGLTPLELAISLEQDGAPGIDRKPVIVLLENAK